MSTAPRMRQLPKGTTRTLEPYKAYNFIDKDPVIDDLRSIIEQENGHRLRRKDLQAIEDAGGAKVGTMEGWFFKDTKRPQSASVESTGRALGWYRPWTKMPADMRKAAEAGTKLASSKKVKPAKYTNGKT